LSLDLSLPHSSPLEGTELKEGSAIFRSQICGVHDIPSPAKRYAERMTRALETTQSELVTIQKELAEHRELPQTCETRKSGKRVQLQIKFVLGAQEVFKIAEEAEKMTATKKGRRQRQEEAISIGVENDEVDMLEMGSSESESDCIVVAAARSTWNRRSSTKRLAYRGASVIKPEFTLQGLWMRQLPNYNPRPLSV
jgi:hypothetical protein